jgi:hypothetical protein
MYVCDVIVCRVQNQVRVLTVISQSLSIHIYHMPTQTTTTEHPWTRPPLNPTNLPSNQPTLHLLTDICIQSRRFSRSSSSMNKSTLRIMLAAIALFIVVTNLRPSHHKALYDAADISERMIMDLIQAGSQSQSSINTRTGSHMSRSGHGDSHSHNENENANASFVDETQTEMASTGTSLTNRPTSTTNLWETSSASVLPKWMKEYFSWHQDSLARLNETNYESQRYLVMRCLQIDDKCGK